jgi:hypothetical protein
MPVSVPEYAASGLKIKEIMSRHPHEIFATEEDRWSWDKYIQRWNLSELNDAERQCTEDSLRYLRIALGEGVTLHISWNSRTFDDAG